MDDLEKVLREIEMEIARIRGEMNDDHRDIQKDIYGLGFQLDKIMQIVDKLLIIKPTDPVINDKAAAQLATWQPLIADVVKAALQIIALILTGKALF